MASVSARLGLAALLSGLQDTTGGPLFKSVWDRKPPRIDRSLFPACVIMIPESENVRTGMRQKHDLFGCQLRIAYAGPSVDWPSAPSGAGGNVFPAPASEPQVLFDQLLDQLEDGLILNQAFTQDIPTDGQISRQVVELGQKISIRRTEPEKRGNSVMLAAVVEFTVREQLLGV